MRPCPPLPEDDRTAEAAPSKFDVARIDPEGASIFAGRAPANAQVTANGRPVATAEGQRGWRVVDRHRAAVYIRRISVVDPDQAERVRCRGGRPKRAHHDCADRACDCDRRQGS